jgi:hypothetical protein
MIEIDMYTLHRLTEKAFKFDDENKKKYKEKISQLLNKENAVDEIINFIDSEYASRKILFAASTADPNKALKPKGRIFRRTINENPIKEVKSSTPDDFQSELDRRIKEAKESAKKHQTFYNHLNFQNDDENEYNDDENKEIENEKIESLLKDQILTSKQLEASEITDTKEDFEKIVKN